MLRTKNIFAFLTAFTLLSSCIEIYYPKEIDADDYSIVVNGQVTNTPGYQSIKISKASSLSHPKFIPIKNCEVQIVDSDNNTFSSTPGGINGDYLVWIDEEHLQVGKAYKIIVVTPDDITIESEYDTLKPCPDIQDVYYQKVALPTSLSGVYENGVQFKIDLIGTEQFDRYFRWELEETYEYRAQFPISLYYDGEIHEVDPPDFSYFYCWKTDRIRNIYNLSTDDLVENKFIGYNLNFVDNHSQRLMYVYSLLVTQTALSQNHFNYLEQLRINASEQGGLFDSQPLSIVGNLISPSHPNLKILGFFGAANSKTKRFIFNNFQDFEFDIPDYCVPQFLFLGFTPFAESDYPVYFLEGFLWAPDICFDCRVSGGTTIKPDFLP